MRMGLPPGKSGRTDQGKAKPDDEKDIKKAGGGGLEVILGTVMAVFQVRSGGTEQYGSIHGLLLSFPVFE